jgi:uncharacterized membrane protein SpoIIM required for sporulation
MNQELFVRTHEPLWQRLEAALARGRRERESADLAELPALYRQVCHHYALARSRCYSGQLIDRLHRLVLRGHQRLYRVRRPLWGRLARAVVADYPRWVRREWPFAAVAAALFFGPLLAVALVVGARPELVYGVLDPGTVRTMEEMYRPDSPRLGREREAESDLKMFGFYVYNNTGIGFRTFAGGIALGLGTVFFLVYNGLHIGAVAGYLTAVGSGGPFWGFVAGHSAPELTAVVLSGAAGLRLGWALVAPGGLTRRRALREAAVRGVTLLYGAAALFLLAAFIEAFWSAMTWQGPALKYGAGIALWLLVLAYLGLGGRDRAP